MVSLSKAPQSTFNDPRQGFFKGNSGGSSRLKMERQMGCSSLANLNFVIRAGLHRQHLQFFSLESAVSGIWKFFSCRCLPGFSS
ncbi:hypothetical protein P8452_70616 [Trifolium repens]|nr:hypothetical protein P8452_70616 [Trifolium repens]